MPSPLDPRVQKAMELLKEASQHFDTEEEATREAQENPVLGTQTLQAFFDDIVKDKTGCSRVSFYVPTGLIEKLIELEKLGIEPNELVTTAIQAAIHTVELSLTATRSTTISPDKRSS